MLPPVGVAPATLLAMPATGLTSSLENFEGLQGSTDLHLSGCHIHSNLDDALSRHLDLWPGVGELFDGTNISQTNVRLISIDLYLETRYTSP